MKQYNSGLIVGKFCPLHNGHVYLIETALDQCETLTILSYTSQYNHMFNPALRRAWLTRLFPTAHVIVLETGFPHDADDDYAHRSFCAELLKKLNINIDVVFGSEEYIPGFAEFLKAQYVIVDLERKKYPISATKIRDGELSIWSSSPEVVMTDNPLRVAFVGGESSGKTTMCEEIERFFTQLGRKSKNIREFGREWYDAKNHVFEFEDMLHVGKTQVSLEEQAMLLAPDDCCTFLFCDTTPLVTATYSKAWFGKVDLELEILALRGYDKVFICMRDFPFVDDGTRSSEEFSVWQQEQYLEAYPDAILLHGSIEERLKTVTDHLLGPACEVNEVPGGNTYWYNYGMFHREDGPAIISPSGKVEYWLNGEFITDDPVVWFAMGHKTVDTQQ